MLKGRLSTSGKKEKEQKGIRATENSILPHLGNIKYNQVSEFRKWWPFVHSYPHEIALSFYLCGISHTYQVGEQYSNLGVIITVLLLPLKRKKDSLCPKIYPSGSGSGKVESIAMWCAQVSLAESTPLLSLLPFLLLLFLSTTLHSYCAHASFPN